MEERTRERPGSLQPDPAPRPRGGRPAGSCDAHVHVFDPARVPFRPERSYTPGAATVGDLERHRLSLHLDRVVLVQPSVYGNDNRLLLEALATLGPTVARGVAVMDPGVDDEELARLVTAGVRGLRVNLESRSERSVERARADIRAVADRAADHALVVQVFADLALVGELEADLARLRAPLVLDHFAGARAELGIRQPGFEALGRLLRDGRAWVKLSGLYRASRRGPGYDDLRPLAEALISAGPDRVVWASDWPHTGGGGERRRRNVDEIEPFREVDDSELLGLVERWAGDPESCRKLLADNPARLFGFGDGQATRTGREVTP